MNKTSKKRKIRKLVSKLSDIAKYLEEAGMAGANELRTAMNAIDGSFVDDGDAAHDQISDHERGSSGSLPYMTDGSREQQISLFDGQSGAPSQPSAFAICELANKLDKLGLYEEANELDSIVLQAGWESSFEGLNPESVEKAGKVIEMLTPSSFTLWTYEDAEASGDEAEMRNALNNYIKDNDLVRFLVDNGRISKEDAMNLLKNRNLSPDEFGGTSNLADIYDEYHDNEAQKKEIEQQDTEPDPQTGWGWSDLYKPEKPWNKPDKTLSSVMSDLIKLANDLDKSGNHDEADEIDAILKKLIPDDMYEIIEDLEEIEDNKKKHKAKPEEDDKEGTDVAVQSNGHVGTGVTDNQNAGMFQGFSDAYFFSGYGNLEAPYK